MPMRMRERVLNRGIPAPRDTLLLQVSQKHNRSSMFFLGFRVRCHAHESPSRQQKSDGRLPSIPSTPQAVIEARKPPRWVAFRLHRKWGAGACRRRRWPPRYHRTAEARSWGNGRATRARIKPSSMAVAIPARAAERNGRRGEHWNSKDPHHPHHAYRMVWMGRKTPI